MLTWWRPEGGANRRELLVGVGAVAAFALIWFGIVVWVSGPFSWDSGVTRTYMDAVVNLDPDAAATAVCPESREYVLTGWKGDLLRLPQVTSYELLRGDRSHSMVQVTDAEGTTRTIALRQQWLDDDHYCLRIWRAQPLG